MSCRQSGRRTALLTLLSVLLCLAACDSNDADTRSAPSGEDNPAAHQEVADHEDIPSIAKRHRRTLLRASHAHWGLDAPVATFAAQVHQESRWRNDARSPVGAQGLAQFMPKTADWFAELYPSHLGDNQPYNPGWALQALVLYDRWLYKRLTAINECNQWAMVLASYNGGLGWVLKDKKLAARSGADRRIWFDHVERFNAGRNSSAFEENRHYPRVILHRWEKVYEQANWGQGVCP